MNKAINEAVSAKDWMALSRLAKNIFGVCVSIRDLKESCQAQLGKHPKSLESSVPWLKNRLIEIGAFDGLGKTNEIKFVTLLHVFFPTLIEDDGMLAMLAWDEEEINLAEARSKIFTTEKIPIPIDRVAQRVSGIVNGKHSQPEAAK